MIELYRTIYHWRSFLTCKATCGGLGNSMMLQTLLLINHCYENGHDLKGTWRGRHHGREMKQNLRGSKRHQSDLSATQFLISFFFFSPLLGGGDAQNICPTFLASLFAMLVSGAVLILHGGDNTTYLLLHGIKTMADVNAQCNPNPDSLKLENVFRMSSSFERK